MDVAAAAVVVVAVEGGFELGRARMKFAEERACTRPWPIFNPNKPWKRDRIQFLTLASLGLVVETDENPRTEALEFRLL